MILSVLLRLTAYTFVIFWSWCCLYLFDWRLTPLVSFGHDVVCTSIDGLPPWYLLMTKRYQRDKPAIEEVQTTSWPKDTKGVSRQSKKYRQHHDQKIRLTPLVSFGHDVVCTSAINGLSLWYILVMMLSVLLRLTAYPFGISWSWCGLYFCDWRGVSCQSKKYRQHHDQKIPKG
jgi:hypothetical protein